MAIALNASVEHYFATTSDTLSLAFGTNADRWCEVFLTCSAAESVTGVTVGGASLTLIASDTTGGGNYGKRYRFGGAVTGTGSQSVVISATGAGIKWGRSLALSGVASNRGGIASGNSTGQPLITGVTSVSGDTILLMGHNNERGATFAPTSPAVEFVDSPFIASYTASGASSDIGGDLSAAGSWSASGAALAPAGGGGGSTLLAKLNHFLRA